MTAPPSDALSDRSPGSLSGTLAERLNRRSRNVQAQQTPELAGRLTRMVGLTLECVGVPMVVGDRCVIQSQGSGVVEAEVVGFEDEKVYLMPLTAIEGLRPGALVVPLSTTSRVPVGNQLLGRVVDGSGEPLDGKGPLHAEARVSLSGDIINPLNRAPVRQPMDVGIRAINALLTVGQGQRLGLFAGSGVGKSVLLGMMTRFTNADVTVVGLIGERGRE
ncbi:MAG: flagellum-specific ATP synthase FliI, partial [Marinobacter sp.]|nr:flagellum-specific ATP synthase FliI [Marinobacter sp.]